MWTWVGQYQNVSILDFLEAKYDRDSGDNWRRKTRKATVKSSPPTNQRQMFYRPHAFSVI